MEINDAMTHAWVTWVRASGLDLSARGWAADPRNILFDKLTGGNIWPKGLPHLTEDEEARIRNLADEHNGYTYAKALLAKHIADTKTVVAGK
jgi:hypothetical protein